MKAYKSCYARYLWRHKFDLDFKSFEHFHNYAYYERSCKRCGLHQRIRVEKPFMMHFLAKESGGK